MLSDYMIRNLCIDPRFKPMIEPFTEGVSGNGIISYGLTSAGYDLRLGNQILMFKASYGEVVNPKKFKDEEYRKRLFDEINFPDGKGELILPPHSYCLGHTLEYLRIPRDMKARVIGKSTLARCFTGDTRVALVNGTQPTLRTLAHRWNKKKEPFYGYGFLPDKGYVAQPLVDVRKIGTEEVLSVHLDNGREIRCTPDHEFILRDLQRRRAEDLRPKDSLLPLYRHDSHGYEAVYNTFTRLWRTTHLLVRDMLVEKGVWEDQPLLDTHHADQDKRNNHPKNLRMVSPTEHGRIHNKEREAEIREQMVKRWEGMTEEQRVEHFKRLHSSESMRKSVESRKKYYATEEGKQMMRDRQTRTWANASDERRRQQSQIIRDILTRKDVTREKLIAALIEAGSIRGASRLLKIDRTGFRRFPDVMKAWKEGTLLNNHKVDRVTRINGKEDVYCLSAPDTGNFALDAGVIVSNCAVLINCTPLEPGWEGHLTLEISNLSPCPVMIFIGEGICQMEVERVEGRIMADYAERGGKYQGQIGVTTARVI